MLHRSFESTRQSLLKARQLRQARFDGGALPDFLPETAHIRNNPTWQCAPPAPGLRDRRVEITGPVDKKMVINALNSGAYTYMADFEDSTSPTWANLMDGQVNMRAAINRTIDFKQSNGKEYKLKPLGQTATLLVEVPDKRRQELLSLPRLREMQARFQSAESDHLIRLA